MASLRLAFVKEVEEESEFKCDTSKILDGLDKIAPKNPSSLIRKDEEGKVDGPDDKEDKSCSQIAVSSKESEKPSLWRLEAEDDEGFRTPTSLDHKIPVITECPPAPKKIRPNPSTKRKEASPVRGRRLRLDQSSTDVESKLPLMIQEDDTDRIIKKVRREDSE